MDYSKRNRKVAIARWKKVHSKVKLNDELSREKVAINSYLCGDGCIKIREKKRMYEIRFYMDDLDVSERIVRLFEKEFGISPAIRKMKTKVQGGKGYYKVEICNKPACENLLGMGNYGSLNWETPQELNDELKKEWIKCFFDCEAHVNLQRRQIQVKSINQKGLANLCEMLEGLGISTKLYGPYKQQKEHHNPYCMLTIMGNENIKKYNELIGFYHGGKIESMKNIMG